MTMPRPRRLRQSRALRELVAETRLSRSALIQPVFVREGLESARPIPGMFDQQQLAESELGAHVQRIAAAGVGGVMLFAIPKHRDAAGSGSGDRGGVLARSVRTAVAAASGRTVVIADLCLDEFTDHGHCGVLDRSGRVDNDATLKAYGQMAIVLAEAGSDLLGLSGMMDGQVAAVRQALDASGYPYTPLLAYSAKFASAFYGPFRAAVESALDGDRSTYQLDLRNRREALRHISLDLRQGADVVMVKPALGYLDIVAEAARLGDVPVAAYVVSGEFAMIEAAAAGGLIPRDQAIVETIHNVRRAGAHIICTYWALEAAERNLVGP